MSFELQHIEGDKWNLCRVGEASLSPFCPSVKCVKSCLQAPSECNPALGVWLVENVDVLDWPPANSRDALRKRAHLGLQRGACRSLRLANSDEYRTPPLWGRSTIFGVMFLWE
jgi:hypothetical protein